MASSDSRQITRPRPSLSCGTCRRRKVRCGREQPACNNCVRTREVCAYENERLDQSGSSAKHKSGKKQNTSREPDQGQDIIASREAWTGTTKEPSSPAPAQQHRTDSMLEESGGSEISRDIAPYPTYPFLSVHGGGDRDSIISSDALPLNGHFSPFVKARSHQSNDTSAILLEWNTTVQAARNPTSSPRDSANYSNSATTPNSVHDRSTTARKHSHTPLQLLQPQKHDLSDSTTDNYGTCLPDIPSRSSKNSRVATFDNAADNFLFSGHLDAQNPSRTQYSQSTFWALLRGHESLCDRFLRVDSNVPEDALYPYIDVAGLGSSIKLLPTEQVCDLLFYSFLIGVRPIHPLIHVPKFRTEYDNFWHWCRNSDTSMPSQQLLKDPTFLCLLFAILYCGAVAGTSSMWSAAALQEFQKDSLTEQLRSMLTTGLNSCQHTRHPTFNTLVASLLGHGCSSLQHEPLEDLSFISLAVRIAQSMGLHRERKLPGLDSVACELRRRVWWHVVWLDVQSVIRHGAQACAGAAEPQNDVRMVSALRDEDIPKHYEGISSSPSESAPKINSTVMLLAIGRYETARFQLFLISKINSTCRFTQAEFDSLVGATKEFHLKIDLLIAQIPAKGIPEKGFIPSRLANASPLTHQSLYHDNSSSPTVFTSWARIMLAMLKLEAVILLQKSFLRPAYATGKQGEMWSSVVQICVSYLQNFLQLTRVPAFSPYAWFYPTQNPPLQPIMIIIAYLEHHPAGHRAHLARYCVDEVIDIFVDENDSHSPESGVKPSKGTPLEWKFFRDLHAKLESISNREQYIPETATSLYPDSETPLTPPMSSLRANLGNDRPNPFNIPGTPKPNKDVYPLISRTPTADPFTHIHPIPQNDPIDPNMMVDISDPDSWTRLVQENEGYLEPGSTLTAMGNDIWGAPFNSSMGAENSASLVQSEDIDYFESWTHLGTTAKETTGVKEKGMAEKLPRSAIGDVWSGQHGDMHDNSSGQPLSTRDDEMTFNFAERFMEEEY